MTRLDEAQYARALAELGERDADLAGVLALHGPPPMWLREPGFPTLVHIILEQQVSLASARAAFERLKVAASPLTPERFMVFDDDALKTIGFSRQKAGYTRALAQEILDGRFDLDELERLPDDAVRDRLTSLKGVGRWSANIYLLMALARPDAWPLGDLALAQAAREVKRLPGRGMMEDAALTALGEAWRPYRAVAARILWHHYLSTPRTRLSPRRSEAEQLG